METWVHILIFYILFIFGFFATNYFYRSENSDLFCILGGYFLGSHEVVLIRKETEIFCLLGETDELF